MIFFEYTLKQSYQEDLQPVVNATDILWINCFILGDNTIFTVEIQMTRNVSVLKNKIKNSSSALLSNIDAKDLKLWHVHLPVDDLSSINCPTSDPEMGNATLLSELFRPVLDPKFVHVIVHVPDHPGTRHSQRGMRYTVAALDQSACFLC